MRACVSWIAVALAIAPTVARADTAAAALDHLDRGVAAFRAADYDTARRELGLAQELAPDRPNPYRWLALTDERLGDCRAALVDVERFLSHVAAGDPRIPEVLGVRERCTHPAPTAPPPPPSTSPPATPITHRWWFWTAIGAGVVGAAAITFAATRGSSEPTLPTVHCGPTGCS